MSGYQPGPGSDSNHYPDNSPPPLGNQPYGQPPAQEAPPAQPAGALPVLNFGQTPVQAGQDVTYAGNPNPAPTQGGYGATPPPVGAATDRVDFSQPGPRLPGQREPRLGRRGLKAILAGALATALAGGGLAAYQFGVFGPVGPQPDEAIPANAVAYVAIDLNPSAGQKVAAYRFLRQFPDLGIKSQDSLKENLIGGALEGNPFGLDYDDDINSWLGDRAAVAAVPDPTSPVGLAPLLALQVKSEGAFEDALDEVTQSMGIPEGAEISMPFGYTVDDGYVLISTSQTITDQAAQSTSLADSTTYASDIADLPDGRVFTAWADMSKMNAALATSMPGLIPAGFSAATGTSVVEGHFEANALEFSGTSHGMENAEGSITSAKTSGMIATLPTDTTFAVAAGGLGGQVATVFEPLAALGSLGPDLAMLGAMADPTGALGLAGMGMDPTSMLDAIGIKVEDIDAVLGSEIVLGGTGFNPAGIEQTESILITGASDDTETAVKSLKKVLGFIGLDVVADKSESHFAVGPDQASVDALRSGASRLGEDPAFTNAIKDQTAGLIAYVNIADMLTGASGFMPDASGLPFEAFGITANSNGDTQDFQARITLK